MRNKWFEEQIADFKTRSDSEVLEYLSNYWNITPYAKGVLTMVGTYKKADHKDKKGNDFAYFEDIRNTEGDILYYPFGMGKVKLPGLHAMINLKNKISGELALSCPLRNLEIRIPL